MANREDQGGKFVKGGKSMTLAALTCLALTACGNAPAPTSSGTGAQSPPQQMTTTKATSAGSGQATNVDIRREVEPNSPVDANNTTVEMGSDAARQATVADRKETHVELPGVKVDSDSAHDKMDIKAPFVHIKKDGHGHTDIKAPFVKIHTSDND